MTSEIRTSQVTYVTMVPRVGNETLRPLGVATGNALSVTRSEDTYEKNTTCWPATAHDVTTGVPQYKCRREDTSSASSSEACVRSMAQSPGDAVRVPMKGNVSGYVCNHGSPSGEQDTACRYGERYTHFTMLRGMQANFAKKASTKPTIPGLRKFPPGRLMAVSDIIPFGQRPELRTLVLTC